MADQYGGGRKKYTAPRNVRKDKSNQKLKPLTNLQTVLSQKGPGMLNEVGLTAYDGGPVWTKPEVDALNSLPSEFANATYNSTVPYGQQAFGANSTSTPTSTGTGGTGSQNQQNFGNEYYWNSPEFAVGKAMNAMGMSTDINSSFANAMASLAPGLKWMSLLGGGPTGGIADFQNNVAGWMGAGGGQGGFGRLGGLNGAIQTLVGGGGGNPLLEGYIDAMDPRQMLAAIGQMAQTAGYGQIAPELLQGLSGQMENIYNQFGINGGDLLANLAPGQSDMDVFRDYFSNAGSGLLDYFGNLGF